ncbi:MAG: hypothetical protein K8R56_10580 [Candidatus Eisenbacteria bacterium]|nr:hypothetical protein [Candidatus Eisenbacteria bacterium]
MLRMIMAGVLGGIAMFVVGSLTHMVVGLVPMRATPFEEQLGAVAQQSLSEPGVYLVPGVPADFRSRPQAEQEQLMKAAEERAQRSPRLFVAYAPPLAKGSLPGQLLTQLTGDVLAALAMALLLTLAQGPATYLLRVLACTAGAVSGSLMTRLPYWNWYGFPSAFTERELLDDLLRALAAALVVALIVRPRR